jgi:hypothetical protein
MKNKEKANEDRPEIDRKGGRRKRSQSSIYKEIWNNNIKK